MTVHSRTQEYPNPVNTQIQLLLFGKTKKLLTASQTLQLVIQITSTCPVPFTNSDTNATSSTLRRNRLRIPGPIDEYANRTPNTKHTPKYTKAKVLSTQDKQSTEQLRRAMLQLLLPYKRPSHLYLTRVCCHTLTPD